MSRFLSVRYEEGYTGVILNGRFMGWSEGETLHQKMLEYRRSSIIDFDVMIGFDKVENMIHIYSDEGRLVRPLLIVNQENWKFNYR